jgi:hypothetical protein
MKKQNPAFECFICDNCGKEFDVQACRAHSQAIIANAEKDSVLLYDLCPACSTMFYSVLSQPKKQPEPQTAQPPAAAINKEGNG